MDLKEGIEHRMAGTKVKRGYAHQRAAQTVRVQLSLDEIETLVRLSSYYGPTLGFVRRIIQLASSGEMRAKARFVKEESYWLRRFAEANRDRMEAGGETASPIDFTTRSLVAFYGRTLGSLNVPRSRRRLSPGQITQREALAEKLRTALMEVDATDHELVVDELQTRRLRERVWIEEALNDRNVQAEN